MGKQGIIVLLVGLTLASIHLAEAQQARKVRRIGYLAAGDSSSPGPLVDAFRQGLRDLGYIEGKNILVEYRYMVGTVNSIPRFLAELAWFTTSGPSSSNFLAS